MNFQGFKRTMKRTQDSLGTTVTLVNLTFKRPTAMLHLLEEFLTAKTTFHLLYLWAMN